MHGPALGFRIARDLTDAERQWAEHGAPDRRGLAEAALASTAASPAPTNPGGAGAPLASVAERVLSVHLVLGGTQDWRRTPQHTHGTTEQDYDISTHLRSDGVLFADNLLDADPSVRASNKQRYYTRSSVLHLRAFNGGSLPRTADEISTLQAHVDANGKTCASDPTCLGSQGDLLAGLAALEQTSTDDLEQLIAPAPPARARWMYFFGFQGCASTLSIRAHTREVGERAYFKGGTHLMQAWSLDAKAEVGAPPEEAGSFCEHYAATLDMRTGDIYLESLYLPSAPGTVTRSYGGKDYPQPEVVPLPTAVREWASARLARTRERAQFSQDMPASAPLDENFTELGEYRGVLHARLDWSFLPTMPAAPDWTAGGAPQPSGTR